MTERVPHPATLLLLLSCSFVINAQWTDPLVYYPFNESSGSLVADFSGNSFDAEASCGDCWETEGKFDGAFRFQGIHKMDLPAKKIGLTNEKGTVAFWMLLPQWSVNQINCIWWAGEYGGDMFGPHNEMHINSEFVEDNTWSGGEIAFVIMDSLADASYFIFSDPEKGPNPAGRNIAIYPSPGTERIEIYSLEGRRIMMQQVPAATEVMEVNIDPLSPGFYYIVAYCNDLLVGASRMIKK